MTDTASTETSVPEAAIEAAAKMLWTHAISGKLGTQQDQDWFDTRWKAIRTDEGCRVYYALAEASLAAAIPHLAPSDAERERVIEGLEKQLPWLNGVVANNKFYDVIHAIDLIASATSAITAIRLLRTPSPLPHVETGGERTLERILSEAEASAASNSDNYMLGYLAEVRSALRAPVEAAPAGVKVRAEISDEGLSGIAEGRFGIEDGALVQSISAELLARRLSAIEAQP